jgi:hypothetical protein
VWILDLLRYEKAWLQAGETTHHLTFARFTYEIEKLAFSLRRHEDLPELEKRYTLLIWLRLTPGGHLWRIRL